MTKSKFEPLFAPASADELDRYLATHRTHGQTSTSEYVEHGATLITQDSLTHLRGLLTFLHEKVATVKESRRLALRVGLLMTYFEEVTLTARPRLTEALKETTFALWYFLKGYDQIPDTVPEIGLLDDALVVEVVLRRNEAELRDHWVRQGRVWPDGV